MIQRNKIRIFARHNRHIFFFSFFFFLAEKRVWTTYRFTVKLCQIHKDFCRSCGYIKLYADFYLGLDLFLSRNCHHSYLCYCTFKNFDLPYLNVFSPVDQKDQREWVKSIQKGRMY